MLNTPMTLMFIYCSYKHVTAVRNPLLQRLSQDRYHTPYALYIHHIESRFKFELGFQ